MMIYDTMCLFLFIFHLSLISLIVIPINDKIKDIDYYPHFSLHSNLEIAVKWNIYSELYIIMSFGSNKKEIELFLSTIDNYVYITEYSSANSSSFEADNIFLQLDFIREGLLGRSSRDDITINSITISKLKFVNLMDSNVIYYYRGALGLGYYFPKSNITDSSMNYSILFQLKSRNIINNYIISLSNAESQKHLILGEYPSNLPQNPNQFIYKTCPLVKQNSNNKPNHLWQCTLNAIYINNNLFTINEPITFSLGGTVMNVPKQFFDFLIETFFKEAIEKKICYIRDDRYHGVRCKEIKELKIKEMNLVIGKWTIKIDTNRLFQRVHLLDSYLFRPVLGVNHCTNEWVFGLTFLRNYQPVFDGEKGEFGLLLNKPELK